MISYKPLWKTLIDRDMTKEHLRTGIGASHSTIAKMGKEQYVALEILDKICTFLNCEISDVIMHKKE